MEQPLDPAELQRKIVQFERFVHEQLEPDLKVTVNQRDAVYDDISEYLRLQKTCELIRENLQDGQPGLKTQVDLGSQCYMQAKVPDASHIYVEVGLGFLVEFTIDEAINFIPRKEAQLKQKAQDLTDKAAEIKTKIKTVLQALADLQQISAPAAPRRQDIL